MNRFTNSSNFLDINVWLSLLIPSHVHAEAARQWFETCDDVRFFFCRITQLGLLRLLTTPAVMREQVLRMDQAWAVFDQLLMDGRIQFLNEPPHLDRHFRLQSSRRSISPKLWSDAYLVAFALSAGLRIVTFDSAFASKDVDALVLS